MGLDKNVPIKNYTKMVNDIPNYYHVKIFLTKDIFNEFKWPIHVIGYKENEWPSAIYEIQNTVLLRY